MRTWRNRHEQVSNVRTAVSADLDAAGAPPLLLVEVCQSINTRERGGTEVTVDELLADLRERIDKGVDELEELALDHEGGREEVRLLGKASGLLVVRGWLRSYDTPENVECPNCDGKGWWWCDVGDGEVIRQRCPNHSIPENVDGLT